MLVSVSYKGVDQVPVCIGGVVCLSTEAPSCVWALTHIAPLKISTLNCFSVNSVDENLISTSALNFTLH